MPKSDSLLEQATKEIEAVNDALRKGAPPVSVNPKVKSAPYVAADSLGADRRRFVPRVGTPSLIGRWQKEYGLSPDWSLWLKQSTQVEIDPVSERRTTDEVASLKTRVRELERRTAKAEDIRQAVAGLFDDPPQPTPFPQLASVKSIEGEVPLLNLYDVHWGEVVDIDRMDGVNSYNRRIAANRLGRYFDRNIDLLTNHWHGPPPPKAYLALGGDLVSGNIHEELTKTNDASPPLAVRELTGYLKEGIERLHDAIDCPIEIISVPGNHSRLSTKPESKKYVVDSYDTLVAWMLEMHFNVPGSPITVTIPASGDALVNIYGRNVLWTHGDRLGTNGGHGGAGPAAPASRGMRRVITEYAARGIHLDTIIMGHIHTSLELEDGFVSGPMSGWNEYARDGRFKPAPASQWLLTMHPLWGIAQRWKIFVGSPEEGSIYQSPAELELAA